MVRASTVDGHGRFAVVVPWRTHSGNFNFGSSDAHIIFLAETPVVATADSHRVLLSHHRYLIMQRVWKTIYKHNTTTDQFVPCAGLVVLFYNDTHDHNEGDGGAKAIFVWNDANNDGSWHTGGASGGSPDWDELRTFDGNDATVPGGRPEANWHYFYDMVQDDFSFTGVHEYGYWRWEVESWDAHGNPVYSTSITQLTNDSVVTARHNYNASTAGEPNPCPTCQGLAPTHGGNEVGDGLMGSHTTSRFVDASHDEIAATQGGVGSQFLRCEQYEKSCFT